MMLDWVTAARLTASSACQSTDEVTARYLDASVSFLELLQPPDVPEPLTNPADWVILYVVPPTVCVYSCGVDARVSSMLAGSLRSCSWDWAASTEAWLCARSS